LERAIAATAGSGARGGSAREAGAGRRVPKPHPPAPGSRLPPLPLVLCYHKVDPRLELGVTRLSPRRFERQVARLARDGWRALSLDELLACARGTRAAGEREVAITFDDGYRALREHAFPVLADHGFSATCSLVTDHVGRLNRWDVAYGGRRFAHLTWRDAERWRARGIAFVSHTATHRRLTWLDDGAVFDELARSREAMRAMLGQAPEVVSYPFGAAGQRELALAQEAGYEAGFVLPERWTGDVMAIPRLPVYPWTTPTPGRGPLKAIEWMGAIGANRCSVGTSYWRRWRRTE
jgi:peptidoglycan/xylan/chitin deacetylase (PgdA/CDA1 family)